MPIRDRFHPILYVRGYAMSRAEQDETTADPFCGFNLGSTVYRATPDRMAPAKKFVFESPLVRLASDFGYGDVFRDGYDIVDPDWDGPIPYRSVVIKTGRVDWLPEDVFPGARVFCMVGTNRGDYEVGQGLSRTFAGHGSDGLVRVENASVWSLDEKTLASQPCATAYAFRSHSGFFGIVNSEEAYQNLSRFLFGDVRVDIWVDVDEVRLPKEIEDGSVEALYQFEVTAAPRGKRWYLTRRMAEEDSVACRKHSELSAGKPGDASRSVYLSTVFLSEWARVDPSRPSLAYSLYLGVRAPDYEVERRFWPDRHYEGAYLFRDAVTIEVTRPDGAAGSGWKAKYDWQSRKAAQATKVAEAKQLDAGRLELSIPFDSKSSPGISGRIRLVVSMWNR
jgi:hypothetical protein